MLISNDPKIEISRVFLSPDEEPPDGRRAFLYLLRKDLQNQYGKEKSVSGTIISPILASLGIMDGFELLSKYWSGRYNADGSASTKFLEEIASFSGDDATTLYQFRCELAHGYKLGPTRGKYVFGIDDKPNVKKCVTKESPSCFVINLWQLKSAFLSSIDKYRSLLDSDFELQSNFVTANANIGEVKIS